MTEESGRAGEGRVPAALASVLGRALAERDVRRLAALDALLVEWSQRLGLTGFETEEDRARRYFAEALSAHPYLPESGEVMDIGSGGGSPALPLAILTPSLKWTLIESRKKKAWFLEEAVTVLGLENVRVEARRFETGAGERWSGVTCRGVRVGASMMREIERSLVPGGVFLWFSAERRLAQAQREGETARWASVEGPVALHRDAAAGGALLVCRRAPST